LKRRWRIAICGSFRARQRSQGFSCWTCVHMKTTCTQIFQNCGLSFIYYLLLYPRILRMYRTSKLLRVFLTALCYTGIRLERLMKLGKMSVSSVDGTASIRTRYLLNTCRDLWLHQAVWSCFVCSYENTKINLILLLSTISWWSAWRTVSHKLWPISSPVLTG
jgi:hypothetical protein